MPIVAFLTMILLGAAAWYWRLKMLREAGSEIIDSVERMRGAYKSRQFRKKAEAAPLTSIKDPAIAAATLYFCLAYEDPIHAGGAAELIKARMQDIIRSEDMDDVMAFASWTAKKVVHPKDAVGRFREIWLENLTASERGQLLEIADAVCDLGLGRTPEQDDTLQTLRRVLLN